MKTPLTYYGGKQGLADQIIQLFPPHRIYVEPFAGGAAVLFAKPPAERETLNDLDGEVMRFWRVVRDRPDELAAAVATTPYSRTEWRDAGLPAGDDVEDARRFLTRIDQSFSRSRESWSVPCIGRGRGRWQPGTWENLPPKILRAVQRLQGVALENSDALKVIERWDVPGSLIYCDPPYTGPLRTQPHKGYEHDDPDLWDPLVEQLLEVEHADVIVSGYPCEQSEVLEAMGWARRDLRMRRTVQARDGSALPLAPETVWMSPGIEAHESMTLIGAAALSNDQEAGQ